MDEREHDRVLAEALARGEENLRVIRLAKNWCSHLQVERSQFGGVGIPEQLTGLPIAPREFRCPYASPSKTVTMDAAAAAIRFYDDNCAACAKRDPVTIPNILELVRERDEERRRAEEAKAKAEEERRAALQARDARRAEIAGRSNEVQRGLIELIEDLDHDPAEEKSRRIVESSRAAPGQFTTEIRGLLYDLLPPGGGARVDAAIGALDQVEPDKASLARVICSVLSGGEYTRLAVASLGRLMHQTDATDLEGALWGVVLVATPTDTFGVPFRPPRPDVQPLLAAFQHHRNTVLEFLHRALRGGRPWARQQAALAVDILLGVDSSLATDMADDLVRAVLLPDDYNARARAAAEETLATALLAAPRPVDATIRRAIELADANDRALLFGVFERMLRLTQHPLGEEAADICLQHIVGEIARLEAGALLMEACRALAYLAQTSPGTVAMAAERLLGVAAMLAERVDTDPRATVVETGMPPELLAMEAENRRSSFFHALNDVVTTVLSLAPRHPAKVAVPALDLLDRIGEQHDRLRAALVKGMGTIGSQAAGLRMALPGLYLGLMHESVLVRAAAAEAYGEIAKAFGEDLPTLAHEAFLLLLVDPYVVVHKAAVRALERGYTAEAYRKRVKVLVLNLLLLYRDSHQDDSFLGDCLEIFVRLHPEEDLDETLTGFVLETLRAMEPNSAWDCVRNMSWRLNTAPGFGSLLVELLANPDTYPFYLPDAARMVQELPAAEISRNAKDIGEVASKAQKSAAGHGNPSIYLLNALSLAGEWDAAEKLISAWASEDDLRRWPGAHDRLTAVACGVNLERAVQDSDDIRIDEAIRTWTEQVRS